jgi:hypothetical protein
LVTGAVKASSSCRCKSCPRSLRYTSVATERTRQVTGMFEASGKRFERVEPQLGGP